MPNCLMQCSVVVFFWKQTLTYPWEWLDYGMSNKASNVVINVNRFQTIHIS